MDGPNDRVPAARANVLRVIAIVRQRFRADEPERATPPRRREGGGEVTPSGAGHLAMLLLTHDCREGLIL